MKKILLLTIVFNLSFLPLIAFAEEDPPTEEFENYEQCAENCEEVNPEASFGDLEPDEDQPAIDQERADCLKQCRDNFPVKKQILPPLAKPDLLPGPIFTDQQNRTGKEVTDYVVKRLLPKIASRLTTIIAVASLLGLVYAGILFFTGLGDPEKMATGKRAAIFSCVGLGVALLSYAIVQIVNLLPLST